LLQYFWGAFLGSLASFWFYILGQYLNRNLPKWFQNLKLKKYTKKMINEFYRILILRDKMDDAIYYDLIEIFQLTKIDEILKGSVLSTGDTLNFNSSLWEIVIVNKLDVCRFTIKDKERNYYSFKTDIKNDEYRFNSTLANFIKFLEERCKKSKIKLNITKEIKLARRNLF
jgi:hypothetical protein